MSQGARSGGLGWLVLLSGVVFTASLLAAGPSPSAGDAKSFSMTPAAAPSASAGGLNSFSIPPAAGPAPARAFASGVARGHARNLPLILRTPPVIKRQPIALIAIILDDLGEQKSAGLRAVNLPGDVACAFLPHTMFSHEQAQLAHARGKEVLLHLPLQPGSGSARPYPTAITLGTGREEMDRYVRSALDSLPHVSGVNNHQGSLLTETPLHMDWLMAELKTRGGLYFVDSRTSAGSLAYRIARARGVPATERSVFLDNARGETAVRAEFQRLIQRARQDERALAIGHPYPETLKVLEEELPRLAQQGIRLVSPSELIAHQSGDSPYYKQLKLSPTLALAAKTPGPGSPGSRSAAAR